MGLVPSFDHAATRAIKVLTTKMMVDFILMPGTMPGEGD
jgi:hypothetical protein